MVGGGITDIGVDVDIRPLSSIGVNLTVGSVQLLDLHSVPGQTLHILRPIKSDLHPPNAPLLHGNLQLKPVGAPEDITVAIVALPVQV